MGLLDAKSAADTMENTSVAWSDADVKEQIKLFEQLEKNKNNTEVDTAIFEAIDKQEQEELLENLQRKKLKPRVKDFIVMEKPREEIEVEGQSGQYCALVEIQKEERYLKVVSKELSELLGVQQDNQTFQVAMKLVSFLRGHGIEELEKSIWFKMLSPLIGKQIKVVKMIKALSMLKGRNPGKTLKLIRAIKMIKNLHKGRKLSRRRPSFGEVVKDGVAVLQMLF